MKVLRSSHVGVIAALLTGALSSAQAGIHVVTDRVSFVSSLSNYGVDSYNDLPAGTSYCTNCVATGYTPLHRMAGDYAYTLSAEGRRLFFTGTAGDTWVSGGNPPVISDHGNPVILRTGAGINAVGGDLFDASSLTPGMSLEPLTVVVTTATQQSTFRFETRTQPFLGFWSDTGDIVSIFVASAQIRSFDTRTAAYPFGTINDAVLGTVSAVPEVGAGTQALVGLAALGLCYRMGRNRRATWPLRARH